MKIKTKLKLLIVLSLAVISMAAIAMAHTRNYVRIYFQKDNTAGLISKGAVELNIIANEFLSYRTDRASGQWQARYASLKALVKNSSLLFGQESEYLDALQKDLEAIQSVFIQVSNPAMAPQSGANLPGYAYTAGLYQTRIATLSQKMVFNTQKLEEMAHQQLAALQNRTGLWILAIILGFISLILAYTLFVTTGVLRSVARLSEGARVIGGADFGYVIPSAGADEFGELTTAFNTMSVRLKQITVSRDELEKEMQERLKVEAELRESDERFRELVKHSPVVYEMYDKQGIQRMVNMAYGELWGIDPRSTLDSFNIWEADRVERLRPYLQRVYAGQTVILPDTFWDPKKQVGIGRSRWISGKMYPLKDDRGEVQNIVILREDITERKQLEDELRRSHKMEAIGLLSGGVAHEFNNLLGIMVGYAELAIDDIPDYKPTQAFLKEIKTAGLRGKEIVRQLLCFSRQSLSHFKAVNMSGIVKEALGYFKTSLPQGVTMKVVLQEDCDALMGDATQLHQVVINLCKNAAQAVDPAAGRITVSVQNVITDHAEQFYDGKLPSGSYVCLQVGDNGVGIADEIMDHIFEPFFTTREVGQGSGMGLAAALGIVKIHGGGIRAQSEAGSGALFTCYFPSVGTENDAIGDRDDQFAALKGKERILMVDDEASVAKIIQMQLERLGYVVQTRTNPLEALQLVEGNPEGFDLVITDLRMPGLPGNELMGRLKKINPHLKTVLYSGFHEGVDEFAAHQWGGDAVLMKPIPWQTLAATIRRVLN